MRIAILWLHAVGGVAWIGAAAVFVIAASAVGLEEDEGLAMVRRIAPIINRIGLVAMLFIVASGILNIYIAGLMRRFVFSNSFVELLAIKIALLSGDVCSADALMARGGEARVGGLVAEPIAQAAA